MRSIFKHKCKFTKKLYNISSTNNTSTLVTQCKCGKTNCVKVHNDSISYLEFILKIQ